MNPQLRLFPYTNPIKKNLGETTFRRLPKRPGVYLFYDGRENLIYVGKAKCLRDRVGSYRHLKPEATSRKVMRLLQRIRSVKWEVCESEKAALLRENELIRTNKPHFNRMNKAPEFYSMLAVFEKKDRIELKVISSHQAEQTAEQTKLIFGPFKAKRSVGQTCAALERLYFLASARASGKVIRFSDYYVGVRESASPKRASFHIKCGKEWDQDSWPELVAALVKWLEHGDREFVSAFELALSKERGGFLGRVVSEDLELLERFRCRCAQIKSLRNLGDVERPFLTGAEFDDLRISGS